MLRSKILVRVKGLIVYILSKYVGKNKTCQARGNVFLYCQGNMQVKLLDQYCVKKSWRESFKFKINKISLKFLLKIICRFLFRGMAAAVLGCRRDDARFCEGRGAATMEGTGPRQ